MQQQTKPTATELLISWQLIWTRVLNGKPGEIKQAVVSHTKLFPMGNQAEARIRAEHTVATHQNEPAKVRAIIHRTKRSLRNA